MAAAEAFDYITDPARWPECWPDLIAVDTPEASWASPGDQMQLRLRFTGRPGMRHERYFEARSGGLRYLSPSATSHDVACCSCSTGQSSRSVSAASCGALSTT